MTNEEAQQLKIGDRVQGTGAYSGSPGPQHRGTINREWHKAYFDEDGDFLDEGAGSNYFDFMLSVRWDDEQFDSYNLVFADEIDKVNILDQVAEAINDPQQEEA